MIQWCTDKSYLYELLMNYERMVYTYLNCMIVAVLYIYLNIKHKTRVAWWWNKALFYDIYLNILALLRRHMNRVGIGSSSDYGILRNWKCFDFDDLRCVVVLRSKFYPNLWLHHDDFKNTECNFLVKYWNMIHTLPIFEIWAHENHSNNFSWMIKNLRFQSLAICIF